MLSAEPQQRTETDALAVASGAAVARIPVNWSAIAPAHPGPGFDPEDPGSPGYGFGLLDAAVRTAVAAGLEPLLVISHAPAFAEAPHRWPYAYAGSWDPDPEALGQFAAAVARRYGGSYAPAGGSLPRVRLLQAWNEPNLARYLEPQWIAAGGRWRAFSPLLYRSLLNAFYAAVKRTVPSDVVVSAGIAPNGDPAGVGRMAPITFLRALFCAGETLACADPAHFDVLAYHPLSVGNPDRVARSSLDVSVADAVKVQQLLRAAERHRTALPAGRKPLWVTELNWESNPPASDGVRADLQAAWVSRALHRLWIAGVSLVCWQFLLDPRDGVLLATDQGGTEREQRPAGLYEDTGTGASLGARAKPFATGFRLPFDPLRLSRGRVRVWALLPASDATAVLQRKDRAGIWHEVAQLDATPAAVVNKIVKLHGHAVLRLVVGGFLSSDASVGAGPWLKAKSAPHRAGAGGDGHHAPGRGRHRALRR